MSCSPNWTCCVLTGRAVSRLDVLFRDWTCCVATGRDVSIPDVLWRDWMGGVETGCVTVFVRLLGFSI